MSRSDSDGDFRSRHRLEQWSSEEDFTTPPGSPKYCRSLISLPLKPLSRKMTSSPGPKVEPRRNFDDKQTNAVAEKEDDPEFINSKERNCEINGSIRMGTLQRREGRSDEEENSIRGSRGSRVLGNGLPRRRTSSESDSGEENLPFTPNIKYNTHRKMRTVSGEDSESESDPGEVPQKNAGKNFPRRNDDDDTDSDVSNSGRTMRESQDPRRKLPPQGDDHSSHISRKQLTQYNDEPDSYRKRRESHDPRRKLAPQEDDYNSHISRKQLSKYNDEPDLDRKRRDSQDPRGKLPPQDDDHSSQISRKQLTQYNDEPDSDRKKRESHDPRRKVLPQDDDHSSHISRKQLMQHNDDPDSHVSDSDRKRRESHAPRRKVLPQDDDHSIDISRKKLMECDDDPLSHDSEIRRPSQDDGFGRYELSGKIPVKDEAARYTDRRKAHEYHFDGSSEYSLGRKPFRGENRPKELTQDDSEQDEDSSSDRENHPKIRQSRDSSSDRGNHPVKAGVVKSRGNESYRNRRDEMKTRQYGAVGSDRESSQGKASAAESSDEEEVNSKGITSRGNYDHPKEKNYPTEHSPEHYKDSQFNEPQKARKVRESQDHISNESDQNDNKKQPYPTSNIGEVDSDDNSYQSQRKIQSLPSHDYDEQVADTDRRLHHKNYAFQRIEDITNEYDKSYRSHNDSSNYVLGGIYGQGTSLQDSTRNKYERRLRSAVDNERCQTKRQESNMSMENEREYRRNSQGRHQDSSEMWYGNKDGERGSERLNRIQSSNTRIFKDRMYEESDSLQYSRSHLHGRRNEHPPEYNEDGYYCEAGRTGISKGDRNLNVGRPYLYENKRDRMAPGEDYGTHREAQFELGHSREFSFMGNRAYEDYSMVGNEYEKDGRYLGEQLVHQKRCPKLKAHNLVAILLQKNCNEYSLSKFMSKCGLESSQIKKVVQRNGHLFEINNEMVSLRPKLNICKEYLREGCSGRDFCGELHICPKHINFACHDRSCSLVHRLDSRHNKEVFRTFFLDKASDETLFEILKMTITQPKPLFPLRVCSFYIKGNCTRSICDFLHICPTFLTGNCIKGCQLSHEFFNTHNSRILRRNGIDINESPRDIIKLLEDQFPLLFKQIRSNAGNERHANKQVTRNQNDYEVGGRPRNSDPPQSSYKKDKQGSGRPKSHDPSQSSYKQDRQESGRPKGRDPPQSSYKQDKQQRSNDSASNNYNMSPHTPRRGNTYAHGDSGSVWSFHYVGNIQDEQICYYSVTSKCRYEDEGCQKLHADQHFHWQVKERGRGWVNLRKPQVLSLEKAYVDPAKDDAKIPAADPKDSPKGILNLLGRDTWEAHFTAMILCNKKTGVTLDLRRLCSEDVDSNVQASWNQWYFLDQNSAWVQYGNIDTTKRDFLVSRITSDDIEKHYVHNGPVPLTFQNSMFSYVLNFQSMTQTNTSTNVSRKVRRRPVPHFKPGRQKSGWTPGLFSWGSNK